MHTNVMNLMFRHVLMAEAGEESQAATGGEATTTTTEQTPASTTETTETQGDGGEAGAEGEQKADAWDLNAPDEETQETGAAETQQEEGKKEGGKATEFALVLPEGYEPDENYLKSATAAAKQFGLDPKAMGLALRAMDKDSDAYHRAELQKDGDRLREDWGTNFDAYVKETKAFARNLESAGVLAPHMKAALNSPEGVRFLHDLSLLMGEDRTMAGAAQASVEMNDARDIMSNPNNPLHQKWLDGDPEVNRRVDKGLGLR